MMDQIVERARRFSRFYTRAVGALGEGYLSSEFSLAEGRVLYELANRNAPGASEIAAALGLDAGYLSRILKRLEVRGLVTRARADDDRRQSRLALTPEGQGVFSSIDSGARAAMAALLDPLPPAKRDRLVEAMGEIEDLLSGAPDEPVRLREPIPGDMGWVIERHGVLYAREQGWDADKFEAHVAELVAKLRLDRDPRRERCWIAGRDGRRLGCVFLAREDETTARLRLLLLEPEARGLGLGRRLVEAALSFARQSGYAEVVLWTHAVLTPARALYASLGFEKITEASHSEFGPEVLSETWKLTL